MNLRNITATALLALAAALPAQEQEGWSLRYNAEAAATLSGGSHTPLWMNAGRYGLSSIERNNGYVRAGIFHDYQGKGYFDYAFGVDLAGAWRNTSAFIVQQAYLDLRYRWFELSIGSKERPMELKDAELSSGGMTFSHNARPIPQVRLSVPEYVNLSKRHIFALKGHIAYGRFTDDAWQKDFTGGKNRYTQGALYHSKSLFGRIGNKEKFPLVFEGGVEMAAQFGGKAYAYPGMDGPIDMPNRFVDFLRVIIPSGSDSTDGEHPNAYGNHLGSWQVSLAWHFKTWTLRAYHEHFFEDHSMIIDEYAWKDYVDEFGHGNFWSYFPPIIPSQYYWKDGLTGIEATLPKNRFVSAIVYEYLGTREQSGAVYHDDTEQIPDQVSGRDNYYNHNIFTGWQHWGQAIGNPLVLSPIYNDDGTIRFKGNRTKSHHIALKGDPTEEVHYRILFSHTRNWGTYAEPYLDIKRNVSMLVEATYSPRRLDGWQATASFAFDKGDLMGNNIGGMLTLRKSGIIHFKKKQP